MKISLLILLGCLTFSVLAAPPPTPMPIRGNPFTTNVPPTRITNQQELVQEAPVTVTTAGSQPNEWGSVLIEQLIPGFIKTTNPKNGPLNVRAFGALGGPNDDTLAVQAAILAAPPGATVWFPPDPTGYYTFSKVTITNNNLTLDFGNNRLTNTSNAELLEFMPASLFLSGRITGLDYPPLFMNGAVPCPVDGDFATLMHENVTASRQTNIIVLNAKSYRDGNFIRAYSVDGFEMRNCEIAAPTWSAARFFHSTKITMNKCSIGGALGTYALFFFKCREANIANNIFQSEGGRAISFKGAIHKSGTPSGTSIFAQLAPTDYEDAKIDVHDNTITYAWDACFMDWPPDWTLDVGTDCGKVIGFTKGDWYGRFNGGAWHDNTFVFNGVYADGKGRAFWASYPHNNWSFTHNSMVNGGVFVAGVDGADISDNFSVNSQTGPNLVFIQEETSNVSRNIKVKNNTHRSVWPAGTGGGTDPQPYYLEGEQMLVEGNKFEIGHTNIANVIVTGPTLDRSFILANRGWANSTNVILPNMVLSTFGGTNNLHGITSDNTCFDQATEAVKTSGWVIFDNGAGSGIQIRMKNGFGGIGFMATNGVDYLSQIWTQISLTETNFVFYHNTAPRITIRADGSTAFYSYLNFAETVDPADLPLTNHVNFFAKDNGAGLTRLYFQESDGTVTEVGTGTGGGGNVVDSAFSSAWNGVLTNAPSMNGVYDWGHLFDTDDDGKVNVLDLTAGLPYTSAAGVLSVAALTADRPVIASAANIPASSVVGASIALKVTPDVLPGSSYARPDGGENDYRVLFAQNEIAIWQLQLPRNYNGSMELDLIWSMASAVAGSVVWSAEIWAVTPGDAADINTQSFDTANTATTAVPGTAGFPSSSTITCSNADSAVASDFVQIRIKRTDALSGDAELVGMTLNYGIK